jgi:hypothetical protein
MRLVREVSHPFCKITIYSWNNRYLIKVEQGLLEQTYKINETELTSEAELDEILDNEFINRALTIFQQMSGNLIDGQSRAGL